MVSCLGDLAVVLETRDLEPDTDVDGDLWREAAPLASVPAAAPEKAGTGDRGRVRSRSRRRDSLNSQFHASNSMFL